MKIQAGRPLSMKMPNSSGDTMPASGEAVGDEAEHRTE